MHLVLECPAYEQIREAMLAQLSELGVRVRWETREMAWSCIMSGEGYARWRVLGQCVAKMLAEREREKERGERGRNGVTYAEALGSQLSVVS